MGKPKKGKFVMSYNNGNNNRRNFNNNRKNGNFNRNNKNNPQNAKKQEIFKQQNRNLDIIESVAEYLDNLVATNVSEGEDNQRITMKEILNYLTTDKGFAQDETKAVSQINYTMMDLANAQRSGYINGNRINIRILYIQERMKTSFRRELYNRIDKIMESYYHLFHWNDDNENKSIEIVTAQEEGTALAVEETTQNNDVETISTKEVVTDEVKTVEDKDVTADQIITEEIGETKEDTNA